MALTRAELVAIIKEQCGPIVAEVVNAKMAEQQAASAPPWAQALMLGQARPTAETAPEDRGLAFAQCVRATAAAKMRGLGPDGAISILKTWGSDHLAEIWTDARQKALAAGDATAGGFLVPTVFSSEVIEFLRAASVVRRLGARTLPVASGTVKIAKLSGGATAYYVGENTNATKSEPTTGQLTLSFKKLITLVPVSNDLIRYASPGADRIVRDDVVNAMRVREDSAFIRDDGTASTPKGLRYWAHADNVLTANGTASIQNTFTDLGKMILQLLNANIPMIAPAWIMAPRTEMYLRTLISANSIRVFGDEMDKGRLWGFPFGSTTSVPVNVGTSSNKSEVYLADMAQSVIGESMNLVVDASQEAAYHDGSSVIAAFSQDQTVVRAIAEHDFGMRYDKAICVLTEVAWQPGSV